MEENASVYQMNTVSRITGEGRAEFPRTWGAYFDQKGGGRGGTGERRGGGGGDGCISQLTQFMPPPETYKN